MQCYTDHRCYCYCCYYCYYFLFFFCYFSEDHSGYATSPKVLRRRTFVDCQCQTFYRPNTLLVIQPALSESALKKLIQSCHPVIQTKLYPGPGLWSGSPIKKVPRDIQPENVIEICLQLFRHWSKIPKNSMSRSILCYRLLSNSPLILLSLTCYPSGKFIKTNHNLLYNPDDRQINKHTNKQTNSIT